MLKWIAGALLAVLVLGGFLMTQNLNTAQSREMAEDGRYVNLDPMPKANTGLFRMLKRYVFEKPATSRPEVGTLPVQTLTAAEVTETSGDVVYRLGHSTVLMRLDGRLWMTDPVFSKRASPVQWAGPSRFHESPIALDDLPPLDGVLISHNHYDHLDKGTIQQLHPKVARFLVPKGVAATLVEWGVADHKIQELEWWQGTEVDGLSFTATPAQHFSGRGLFDANASLWVSWVIASPQRRLFFSGDSGYFSGFKAIGEAYGPFDLTMIETGAYDADWPGVHMSPEESLQAHKDLQGKRMMPIHNSTFDLAFHPWYEPLEELLQLAEGERQSVLTPLMGAPLRLEQPKATTAWWRALMTPGALATVGNRS